MGAKKKGLKGQRPQANVLLDKEEQYYKGKGHNNRKQDVTNKQRRQERRFARVQEEGDVA